MYYLRNKMTYMIFLVGHFYDFCGTIFKTLVQDPTTRDKPIEQQGLWGHNATG